MKKNYEEPKVVITKFEIGEKVMMDIVSGNVPDTPVGKSRDLW